MPKNLMHATMGKRNPSAVAPAAAAAAAAQPQATPPPSLVAATPTPAVTAAAAVVVDTPAVATDSPVINDTVSDKPATPTTVPVTSALQHSKAMDIVQVGTTLYKFCYFFLIKFLILGRIDFNLVSC